MQVLKNLKSKLLHKYFDWDVKEALSLLPIVRTKVQPELCVLTMLCKRDFFQYLISIHSFTSLLNPQKIVVVNDGSLEQWHLDHLKSFITDIEIYNGTDFIDERVPTYTSWRRMLAIESLISSFYVIQLDADLLSRHDLDEIKDAYKNNYSFILGTEFQSFSTLDEAQLAAKARNQTSNKHVQHQSELNLDILKTINFKGYVRGCAGFAGYAKGSFSKQTLIEISNCMFSRIGDKWREWGSEQTAANMLISNMENSAILPLSKYGSVARYHDELKVVHFLGTWRFDGFIYNTLAKSYIAKHQS